jgi:hypothetical protein
MWSALGAVVLVYLLVGLFVFVRQARTRSTFPRGASLYAEVGPFLVVLALWPLYVRRRAEQRPASAENAGLLCGAEIPSRAGSEGIYPTD